MASGYMHRTRYDYFVSYAHDDHKLVEQFAAALAQNGVRLWWDQWEMKPGDVLRERINDGIEQSSGYIVIVSPSSLRSSWVQHELNTAFIHAIEDREVRLISALVGDITFDDLPPDLRARFGLDLRTEAAFVRSVDQLVDLAQPDRRKRAELLERLRNPERSGTSPADLARFALRGGDQQIQIAALRGLTRTSSAAAVVVCAERSLDTWGVSAIKAAIQSLGRLGPQGGLLALAATSLYDSRFIHERLTEMTRAATALESKSALASIDRAKAAHGFHFDLTSWAPQFLDALASSADPDVRHGALFARTHNHARWIGPAIAGDEPVTAIRQYFERRVAGLYDALIRGDERRSATDDYATPY